MAERLNYSVPQILPHENERVDKKGNPIGMYCRINTRELILPQAVTKEKYDYIFDAYFDGTFDVLTPTKRYVLLTYYSTGHNFKTLGKLLRINQSSIYFHAKTGNEIVWQNTSGETKQKYTHQTAIQHKDKYEIRKGRPISEKQKERLRKIAADKMTSEERERLRQIGKAFMTKEERDKRRRITTDMMRNPAVRDNLRRKRLEIGEKRRAELAFTDPEAAKVLERKARRPYIKTLYADLNNLRRKKFPEYIPPEITIAIKPKTEIKHVPKSTSFKPKAKPTEHVKTPVKKADLKVEERLADPRAGAVRNVEFLEKGLPTKIKDSYANNPDLYAEWKTVHYCISHSPYLKYTEGKLYYVITNEEQKEVLYPFTTHLIDSLWNGTNFLPMDRDIIIHFGRFSIEDIGYLLKTRATSL